MAAPNPPDPLVALRGRRVVLGVTGGIAAYKAAEVCRRLVDAGAHVVPVLTSDAQRFIGALTFSALASEPARTSLFDGPDPIPHTRLGREADLIVVAPATAKLVGKYAHGISDDLLTATLLATDAPVLLAPAMHTEMWEHAAVQDNLDVLRARGVHVVPPDEGRLAGGDVGPGRLAAPEHIVAAAADVLAATGDLGGVRLLVTAGGTREPIDPVRFVGNRSSGKMGCAVAEAAAPRSRSSRRPAAPPMCPASRSSTWRPPTTWLGRCSPAFRTPTPWSWRRRWRTSGPRRSPTRSSRSATASPRSCSSRHPTSSRCSASASSRGSSWSGSPRKPSA